jgi:hypothetical protein
LAGQDLRSAKRFFLGKHVFYYKLLNPFPETGFLSGIDSGFCALNIAMNYRHNKFRDPSSPLSMGATTPGPVTPIQRQMIPKGGIILGIGSSDEFWTPTQVCDAAKSNNYQKSEVIQGINFDNIKELIKNDHVALVAFDVDTLGNPGSYSGANAHWAVIVGYGIFHDGSKYLIATHSWGGFYIWSLDQLVYSNSQLLNLPQTMQTQVVANGPVLSNPPPQSICLNVVRDKMVAIAA